MLSRSLQAFQFVLLIAILAACTAVLACNGMCYIGLIMLICCLSEQHFPGDETVPTCVNVWNKASRKHWNNFHFAAKAESTYCFTRVR